MFFFLIYCSRSSPEHHSTSTMFPMMSLSGLDHDLFSSSFTLVKVNSFIIHLTRCCCLPALTRSVISLFFWTFCPATVFPSDSVTCCSPVDSSLVSWKLLLLNNKAQHHQTNQLQLIIWVSHAFLSCSDLSQRLFYVVQRIHSKHSPAAEPLDDLYS